MEFNDALDNGQAQAGAAMGGCPGFFNPVKLVENQGELISRDSRAGVGDFHGNGIVRFM